MPESLSAPLTKANSFTSYVQGAMEINLLHRAWRVVAIPEAVRVGLFHVRALMQVHKP